MLAIVHCFWLPVWHNSVPKDLSILHILSGTKPLVSHFGQPLTLDVQYHVLAIFHCFLLAVCFFLWLFVASRLMCAAQHVARLLLHCVDRKKELLALCCHSFGPECGLVWEFVVYWKFEVNPGSNRKSWNIIKYQIIPFQWFIWMYMLDTPTWMNMLCRTRFGKGLAIWYPQKISCFVVKLPAISVKFWIYAPRRYLQIKIAPWKSFHPR